MKLINKVRDCLLRPPKQQNKKIGEALKIKTGPILYDYLKSDFGHPHKQLSNVAC